MRNGCETRLLDPFGFNSAFVLIGMRLRAAGVGAFEDLALDTYADPERFFSYRRSAHKQEPDYGRLVSAIALR
jgi:copper oxidase (laccase) domain-containing protein